MTAVEDDEMLLRALPEYDHDEDDPPECWLGWAVWAGIVASGLVAGAAVALAVLRRLR